MATSTPYNVANGSNAAGSGQTFVLLSVGTGTGSPTGTSAGDMVYVLTSDGLAEAPTSVVDSQGHTYTAQVVGSGAQRCHLWTTLTTAPLVSGTDLINVNWPSSTGNKIAIACGASGVLATVDKSNTAAGTSTAPSSGSSGGPLAQASELVIGGIRYASGGTTTLSAPSFGAELKVTQSAAMSEFHQVVSATTAKTMSATLSGSVIWAALVGTFKISLPVITTTGLPNALSGSAYSQTLTVSGGLPSYTWAVTGGSLTGSGLSLSSSGVLSGTASAAATYSFTATVTDGNGNTDPQALTVTVTNSGAGAFTRVQAGSAASGTGSVSPVISASTAGNLLVAALSAPAPGQFTGPAGWLPAVQAGGGGGLYGERNKTFDLLTGAGVTGLSTAIAYPGTQPYPGVPSSWYTFHSDVVTQIADYQPTLADTISGAVDAAHLAFWAGAPNGSWVMPYHEPGVGSGNNPNPGPPVGSAPGDIQALDRHLIALKNRNYPTLQYGRGLATLGGAVNTMQWIDQGQAFTATNAAPCVFTSSPALDVTPNGMSVILKGGSLPTGFTANTVYYIVNASGTTFQLAHTIGGTGITSTSTGSGTVVPVPDFYGMDGYQHAKQYPSKTPSAEFAFTVSNILAANPIARIAIIETMTAAGTTGTPGTPPPTPVQGVTQWFQAIAAFVTANPSIFSVNSYFTDPSDTTPGPGSQYWSNSFAPACQALSNAMAAGGSSDVEIWYYPNCPAGITTAAFTGPGGANCRGAIAEFSSPAGTSQALDGPGGATGAAAPPLVTSLPVTAQSSSAAGDLGIAVFGDFFSSNQSGSWTTPSGWTLNAAFSGSGTGANLFAFYEKTGLGSGVQSVTGTYSVSAGQTSWAAAVATFSQVFSAPVITTSSLSGGTVGTSYTSTAMAATGGTAPYTWSAGAGKPAGVLLSSAGAWSGSPAAAGSYTFNVTVTDQNGATGSKSFTVTVAAAVTIITSGLPGGTVGTPYSAPNMAAAGGTAPFTWAVTSGSLPAGVALSSGGVWSGTPTTAATYGFTIGVTDANGSTAAGTFSVIIAPSGTPPPPPLNTAFPGAPLGILVELQVNGTWNDITGYVYVRDGINITGGTSQQGTTPSPANCTMTLNNRDSRFSPGTAGSIAAWGGPYLIRNMQLRVSVTATSVTGVHYSGYRFWGVVSQWPPQSDISGNDAYVQISADGPLRQISQGGGKGGALVRYYHSLAGTAFAPVAYWPCEDDTNALFIGSGVFDGQVMTITGRPLFKGISSFNGSAPMGTLNKSTWTGTTGSFSSSGDDVFTVPGTYTWVASTSVADIRCTGGGGGGSGSAGNGGAGGTSSFAGATPAVTAAGGGGGAGASGGAGGTGSANFTHFHGGAGAGATSGGGGGGSSGGSAAIGNPGSGNTGGAAVAGGGAGGNGGAPGLAPGGGGGGASGPLGGGGGGGEFAEEPALALIPGQPYTVTVGAGGRAGSNAAAAGGGGTVEMIYQASGKGTPPPINVVRFLMQVPPFGGNNGAVLLRFLTAVAVTGSNLTKLDVVYVAPGKLQLKGYTGAGGSSLNFTSGNLTVGDGQPVMVSVELFNNNSGGVKYNMRAIIPGAPAVLGTVSGTVTSSVIDNVTQVIAGPNGDVTKTAIGHISVQAAFVPLTTVSDALNGHSGEMGIDRFIRLCAEQSLGSGVQFAEQSDHWGFEGGVQSWTGSNCTLATSTFSIPFSFPAAAGWPSQGTQSLLATSTAVGAFSAQSPGGTAGQPVNPGDIVTAGADVVTTGAGVTAAYMGIQFWTATGTAIGTPVIASTPVALTANTPVTLKAKTAPGAVAGAPATAAFFSLVVGNSDAASAAGTVLYIDNVRVSPRMGTQTREAYQDYLAQIHDLEQGLMKEAKTFWGLAYRTRIALFNQVPEVILDYSLGQVAPPLQPVQDDKLTVTQVTVKRSEGSRVTVSQSAGQLTTGLPSPNGQPAPVNKQVKIVAEDDAQLIALADHLLNLGTDLSTRYPVITANLARTATAPLFAAIASVEIGDRVQIINLPGFYPEATADQLVIGYTETLNYNVWTVAWNCTPASPWTISVTNTRRW